MARLQTRECEVEHVSIGRTARLKGRAIEDREAKQVHLVIAAMDQDRWGSGAEWARFQATRYRPAGIDRNVAGVQKHAGSPAAIDGGSFKRRSKTYPAVAAGDRSEIEDLHIIAQRTADKQPDAAAAANPIAAISVAAVTAITAVAAIAARSVAAGARVITGISTVATSAISTGAADTTSAAISSDAGKSTDTNSAVAGGYRAEIQDFRVNDRRARSHPKAVAAIATNPVAAISVAAVTAITAVAAVTASSVAASAARSANNGAAAVATATRAKHTDAAIATTAACTAVTALS